MMSQGYRDERNPYVGALLIAGMIGSLLLLAFGLSLAI